MDIHGNILQVFKGHENNVTSVVFSNDGRIFLLVPGIKQPGSGTFMGTY